ncbi:hypothetical protein EGR_10938 [Echinococcus granulosus]|uniref:Uncharacterized protein n=1 Tax=Echinococcus granulosus TaxID=6210 RepID=W6U759_ECHGR|nr:hypothetical protein EGR_10938 [Echinococcus granulosus]EUB54202.1 hypothetical protein EGR_10938 [Echinococcus granulosus]
MERDMDAHAVYLRHMILVCDESKFNLMLNSIHSPLYLSYGVSASHSADKFVGIPQCCSYVLGNYACLQNNHLTLPFENKYPPYVATFRIPNYSSKSKKTGEGMEIRLMTRPSYLYAAYAARHWQVLVRQKSSLHSEYFGWYQIQAFSTISSNCFLCQMRNLTSLASAND